MERLALRGCAEIRRRCCLVALNAAQTTRKSSPYDVDMGVRLARTRALCFQSVWFLKSIARKSEDADGPVWYLESKWSIIILVVQKEFLSLPEIHLGTATRILMSPQVRSNWKIT